ncbi:MAG: divalent-cation tolerance protein CutA [Deltaproteobacteria bacterium]|nr:divalent-cation tolerance protein CutA [Deltaproteobacteria bacterium]
MLSIILSSCPSNAADALARSLVERRVAACVSALPGARSTYAWQGEIQCEEEALLLIKTPTDRVAACMAELRALHPYTVPEMVEIAAGSVGADYLAWAVAMTRPAAELPEP